MRKILSLFLVVCMLFSMSALVFADDSHMTEIKYVGEGVSEWELDVPKTMAPGDTGVVELSGTWSSEEKVIVSAPDKVTLTNELDEDTKDLTVTFGSLEVIGDNTDSILETKNISVSDISNALFGTWKGYIVYSVKVEEINHLIHNGVIPEGGSYYVMATVSEESEVGDYSTATATYTAGDSFPGTVSDGDVYIYGDYEYRYNAEFTGMGTWALWDFDGWGVRVLDNSKSEYGAILEEINGVPITSLNYTFWGSSLTSVPVIPESVTSMNRTFFGCPLVSASELIIPSGVTSMYGIFEDCTSLESAPIIPESVMNMNSAFQYCTSLDSAPIIPESVIDIGNTFANCHSLVTAPIIPESVTDMSYTFYNCTSLIGSVVINATNLTDYGYCFENTERYITLTGSCPQLSELAATSTYANVTVKSE